MRHHRASPDLGSATHCNGGDQHRATPDKGASTDYRAVLSLPVIVAGDRARADVGVLANLGVANVAEMPHLGAGRQIGVLHLAKVAHVNANPQVCALAQMAKRPDVSPIFENCLLEHRCDHPAVISYACIADQRVRAQRASLSNNCAPLQNRIRVDDCVSANLNGRLHVRGSGVHQRDSPQHEAFVDALPDDSLAESKMHASIDPLHFGDVLDGHHLHRALLCDGETDHVGEIVLPFRRSGGDIRKALPQPVPVKAIDAAIQLLDRQDLRRRRCFFNDGHDMPSLVAHHSPKAHRVLRLYGQDGDSGPTLRVQRDQPLQGLKA